MDDEFDVVVIVAFVEGIDYYHKRVGILGTAIDLA